MGPHMLYAPYLPVVELPLMPSQTPNPQTVPKRSLILEAEAESFTTQESELSMHEQSSASGIGGRVLLDLQLGPTDGHGRGELVGL